jgi:beta-glucuronidase
MKYLLLFTVILTSFLYSQEQILNIPGRHTTSLNGEWSIIIDPYENGYYNYRYEESPWGYFKNAKPQTKSDLLEYDFDNSDKLKVPGDWNTQREDLFFYEGTVWYKKSFNYSPKQGMRQFIHFGAVNYNAKVYVNGEKLGEHTGGFTPFNFEVTPVLIDGENFVVVKVDNKRLREGVPTLNTDWWNYGGITRDVNLIEVPDVFIKDYFIQSDPGSEKKITGWVKLNGEGTPGQIRIRIDEAGINNSFNTDEYGLCNFSFKGNLQYWSPESPRLYEVIIESENDTLREKIGFRSIKTSGTDILLNGRPVFLRGISIHEEAPVRGGRAYSMEDAQQILTSAKELGCNFVRLAHYPHNENMTRLADEMGIMVWSEIPVYWTILWENEETYKLASTQLNEMISRDKNRASVIIWSVANETPRSDKRLKFLTGLISEGKKLDNTRLFSAATELNYKGREITVDDPLSEYLDVIGANEYLGWYSYLPEEIKEFKWSTDFNKPLIITEFGAGAKYGMHGDEQTRWTEEYQDAVYREQIKMLSKIEFLKGMSPWILYDFRSPRRPLPGIQDFYNRKGLISNDGNKKQAFYTLQNFYENKKDKYSNMNNILITAHRGASGYAPENTLSSIKAAIEMGADFAEIDVQETMDGEIVLLHDGNLKRTTGLDKGIWETNFVELKTLEAGSWFNEKFQGETIPTLSEVIDSVKGKIKINIELKTNGHEKELAERTVRIVKGKDFQQDCIFTSFSRSQIEKVREIDPGLKTGLIFSKYPQDQDVFTANYDLLSVHYSLVDSVFIKRALNTGKKVHVWTVNEEAEMKRLINLGVTSIITNFPDKLRNILEGK